MNTMNNEIEVTIKPVYDNYITIDEEIHQALSLYALSLYMAFRYEASYRRSTSEIKRSAKFLYTKAKISRAHYYRCLNELEEHGLIMRDEDNEIGQKCTFHVAKELGYFSRGVSHRDRGVSDRDTCHYLSSLGSINTTSDISTIKTQEVIEAYHEVLPDCPKIKVAGAELTKQVRAMIKNWPKYQKDGKSFTIDSFKDYLNYLKEHYTWFVTPYVTESGKTRRNNLTNFTREKNIVRIVNGEFSAN